MIQNLIVLRVSNGLPPPPPPPRPRDHPRTVVRIELFAFPIHLHTLDFAQYNQLFKNPIRQVASLSKNRVQY